MWCLPQREDFGRERGEGALKPYSDLSSNHDVHFLFNNDICARLSPNTPDATWVLRRVLESRKPLEPSDGSDWKGQRGSSVAAGATCPAAGGLTQSPWVPHEHRQERTPKHRAQKSSEHRPHTNQERTRFLHARGEGEMINPLCGSETIFPPTVLVSICKRGS